MRHLPMPPRPNQRALICWGEAAQTGSTAATLRLGFSYTRISRVGGRRDPPHRCHGYLIPFRGERCHEYIPPAGYSHATRPTLLKFRSAPRWKDTGMAQGILIARVSPFHHHHQSCHQTAKLWELHLSCTDEEGRNSRWCHDGSSIGSTLSAAGSSCG